MKKLAIAEELALPIEVVTEKTALIGRTGSGKTYAALRLAELMHKAGAQFVAIDPVGKWWSLRLAADGKSPGISLPVFGGLQGDVPIEPAAGELIADVIVDRGISAVVDVSQFESDADKARFATDFGARLFFRKKALPSALHIFVEEAQEFIPQNSQRDEALMLHVWTRIQKLGRNFGIGTSLLTQRPQEVNKKVLNQTELLFVFQLTGPQERRAVADWIEEKGLDADLAAELPKLKRGAPHVWSPSWLDISRVVTITDRWTFDASSTPKVGARAEVRELAPIDLEQLGKEIAASKAKAEAEDPKRLRAEITQLRAQLAKAPKATTEKTVAVADPRAIERAVRDAVTKIKAEFDRRVTEATSTMRGQARALKDATAQLDADIASLMRGLLARIDAPVLIERPAPPPPPPPPPAREQTLRRVEAPTETGELRLTNTHRKILNAIAELEARGISPVSRVQGGVAAGLQLTGGGGGNATGQLVTHGFLAIPSQGMLQLTDEGRRHAVVPDTSVTNEDAQRRALDRLNNTERRILEHLIGLWPRDVSRADASESLGLVLTGGGGGNALGRLVTLGFVTKPRKGWIRAADILFPEEACRA